MLKKVLQSTLLLAAVFTIGFVADVTGHWTGRINDQFDVAYDFKADGSTLTGTTKGPDGNVIEIKDGVIKDDSVKFTLPIMGRDMFIKGKVNGDVMTLSMDFNGNAMSFDLKKDAK